MQDIAIVQFLSFSKSFQCIFLYKDGVYIGKRKKEQKTFVLYQLDGFYVEIVYNQYRQYIASINCTSDVDITEPYLLQVNVEELVNIVG